MGSIIKVLPSFDNTSGIYFVGTAVLFATLLGAVATDASNKVLNKVSKLGTYLSTYSLVAPLIKLITLFITFFFTANAAALSNVPAAFNVLTVT